MSNCDDVVNRVIKNQRHLSRWCRREQIEAFRVYDRDIPEFPIAIDRYRDWLHVQVYERKRSLEPQVVDILCAALAERLELPRAQVIAKARQRQRGSTQYTRSDNDTPSFNVSERGLFFEVNLGRYLDTGLFLDHRETREMVRNMASNRRVLNLFAYTGSFTVYAAAGGAHMTVSVDLSKTYQAWTRRNLVRNGFDDPSQHRLVRGDASDFIDRMRQQKVSFDLIVVDPPSFSNSKRTRTVFDIQRDHVDLLQRTRTLLAAGGTLLFSTNRQGFRLDPVLLDENPPEETTARTVPEDFRRHRPHRCWTFVGT